jgi:hypothetical protein
MMIIYSETVIIQIQHDKLSLGNLFDRLPVRALNKLLLLYYDRECWSKKTNGLYI